MGEPDDNEEKAAEDVRVKSEQAAADAAEEEKAKKEASDAADALQIKNEKIEVQRRKNQKVENEKQAARQAVANDEVDPLDAFMMGVQTEVRRVHHFIFIEQKSTPEMISFGLFSSGGGCCLLLGWIYGERRC